MAGVLLPDLGSVVWNPEPFEHPVPCPTEVPKICEAPPDRTQCKASRVNKWRHIIE
ncbi:hypothetical protein BC567DRAFT_228734 [Phyllosticta citribraziliensis]